MPDVTRLGRAACGLAVLAVAFLAGCATKTPVGSASDDEGYYAGVVSAREYGYVRPARDVVILGRTANGRQPRGGDVWNRVRSGMRLNLHADARIDRTLERIQRDPSYFDRMARQARPYLPVILAEIERRGFPTELALLPHVESRYNPAATSPKSAAGIWQFMPYTAREMGLRLDGSRDERRDVFASTRAALDYLEQLNRRFNGDWELAMAAYNCGPGRVESAQAANRRKGEPTDFWSLNLPEETKQYVPKILATARLVTESPHPGLRLRSTTDPSKIAVRIRQRHRASMDEEMRDGKVHVVKNGESLASLALRHGIDLKTLAAWNGLTSHDPLLPGQTLRIPTKQAPELVTYRVRKGDSIAAIARRYGVTVADIRRWNRVADNRLQPGDKLRIYRRGMRSES